MGRDESLYIQRETLQCIICHTRYKTCVFIGSRFRRCLLQCLCLMYHYYSSALTFAIAVVAIVLFWSDVVGGASVAVTVVVDFAFIASVIFTLDNS